MTSEIPPEQEHTQITLQTPRGLRQGGSPRAFIGSGQMMCLKAKGVAGCQLQMKLLMSANGERGENWWLEQQWENF